MHKLLPYFLRECAESFFLRLLITEMSQSYLRAVVLRSAIPFYTCMFRFTDENAKVIRIVR